MSLANEVMIHLDFEALVEGGFVATSPDVEGPVAQGRTVAEAIEIARDVARKIVESRLEQSHPLPPAFQRSELPKSIQVDIPVPKRYGTSSIGTGNSLIGHRSLFR